MAEFCIKPKIMNGITATLLANAAQTVFILPINLNIRSSFALENGVASSNSITCRTFAYMPTRH